LQRCKKCKRKSLVTISALRVLIVCAAMVVCVLQVSFLC
jgi:hypothetical protein